MAMRIIKYIGIAAALLAAAASCSIKDEEAAMEGPARVIISGHILNSIDGEPISGAQVELQKKSVGKGDGHQAMSKPQKAQTGLEGYYSFESYMDGETESFEVKCSHASRSITVSRGDQSFDSKRNCYIVDMVDLFL